MVLSAIYSDANKGAKHLRHDAGLTDYSKNVMTKLDCFKLFFDDVAMNLIVGHECER